MPELTQHTERYARVNVTRNTKGYGYETTVSIRWSGDDPLGLTEELANLNRTADAAAREEIALRQATDEVIP